MSPPKKKTEKAKTTFKALSEPDIWESGERISRASYLEKEDGTKGISVKLGKKSRDGKPYYTNSKLWLDEKFDFPNWVKWFVKSVRKGYLLLFEKTIEGAEVEEAYYKQTVEDLNKQLKEAEQKHEQARRALEESVAAVELAKSAPGTPDFYSGKIKEFKELLQRSVAESKGLEEEIKRFIKENQWILGLECSVEAKNQNIDNQTEIDIHVKTKYDQQRIFEIKSPNVKPFVRRAGPKSRSSISPELANALSELVVYMKRTDFYSNVSTSGTYGIPKASGIVVTGMSLEKDEKELLDELNFHLKPHICIVTYEQLLNSTEREVDLIKRSKA